MCKNPTDWHFKMVDNRPEMIKNVQKQARNGDWNKAECSKLMQNDHQLLENSKKWSRNDGKQARNNLEMIR